MGDFGALIGKARGLVTLGHAGMLRCGRKARGTARAASGAAVRTPCRPRLDPRPGSQARLWVGCDAEVVSGMKGEGGGVRRAARELADEFGASVPGMEAFLRRFAPRWTETGQFHAASDVMLFVHIPKTGGMSFGQSLAMGFDRFRPVTWPDTARSFRLQMRQALYRQTQKAGRQVLIGHFGWEQLTYWRSHDLPLKCGTLLRDPLARMVSNFYYNMSEAHPGHATFRARFPDLLGYVRQQPVDVQMTQAIGIVDSFDRALERFCTHYSFLGVTEHLGASLAQLARTHGLQGMEEHRINQGGGRQAADVTEEVVELIARKSHNDRKLHRLLLRLYAGA